jgi:hypothetical protein
VHGIYFWPQPIETLTDFARVLRPSGRIVLAFRAGQHALTRRLDPAIYRTLPTTEQAIEWLESVGFTDVRAETRPATPFVWILAVAP